MAATALKEGTDTELRSILESVVSTIGETLSSLVGRDIQVKPDEMLVHDKASLLAALPGPSAVARGAMDKDFAGKYMLTLIEVPDAVSMAGLLMMTPDDIIAQRRESGTFEGEDVEAFGELGNVLYSGFSKVLRDKIKNFDVRMQDQGLVQTSDSETDILGTESLVTFSFKMQVADSPESIGLVGIDLETAEKWNQGPIQTSADDGNPESAASLAQKHDDDGLDSIPAAPIRGTLASFVIHSDVYRMLRRSCRRVGLDLCRHGRGEIPNPAAHRNEVVLLDIPPAEERRFGWCRRIKDLSKTTKVVLLLHHASRPRVTQAFLSQADAILGFPCEEQELSQKLEQILGELQTEDEPPAEGDE